MYQVILKKDVIKFLATHTELQIRFYEKIKEIKSNPFSKALDIQKYPDWWENHYRFRLWNYRFLYYIIKNELVIYFYDADSRGDIYK